MAIEIRCPNCNRLGHAPDEAAGKKIRCPVCQAITPVPATGVKTVASPHLAPRSLFDNDRSGAESETNSAVRSRPQPSPASEPIPKASFIPLQAVPAAPPPSPPRLRPLSSIPAPPPATAPASQPPPLAGRAAKSAPTDADEELRRSRIAALRKLGRRNQGLEEWESAADMDTESEDSSPAFWPVVVALAFAGLMVGTTAGVFVYLSLQVYALGNSSAAASRQEVGEASRSFDQSSLIEPPGYPFGPR